MNKYINALRVALATGKLRPSEILALYESPLTPQDIKDRINQAHSLELLAGHLAREVCQMYEEIK